MALSAMNYLLNIIPHAFISSNQLCQPVRSIFCDMDRSSGPKCYTNYLPLCVIRKSLVRQCFESLENKMSSGRFASLHEAELEQITDSRLSQNTKNATKYAVKTFLYFFLICQVNLNTAPNSCALYMQCIHGIVLLHLFVKK